MTELTPCEFFLFRYVPDVVRGEFINIGILIRRSDSPQSLVRFTRDWSRVQAAGADVVFLEEFEADIVERLRDESVDAVLEEFLESLSNSI